MCETKYLSKYIAAVCKTFSKVIFDVKKFKQLFIVRCFSVNKKTHWLQVSATKLLGD